MSIKKLFGKNKATKIVSAKSLSNLGTEVESSNNIVSSAKEIKRYLPPVDFSSASNFARYGSAEKYYEDAVKRVYTQYPYDGSDAEKADYSLSSSYLDLYILDEKYPRTTGYVILSADGWGTRVGDYDGYGAPATASFEYISIKGGPNTNLTATDSLASGFTGDHNQNNVFDVSLKRASNLTLDPSEGNTVEFWLKKTAFDATKTKKEVIFDLWNNEDSSSAGYGRLTIELSASLSASQSPFRITYMSGTKGYSNQLIGASLSTASVANDTWNHYALTFEADDADMVNRLYINGTLNDTQIIAAGAELSELTGALVANIGALRTAPSGAINAVQGWGKMSASLDEFRFWKKTRTAKDIRSNYWTQVAGGANTDAANTDLGVYYKFNEGITTTASLDSIVLDFSGRISDGAWTGYTSNSRNTGSAMVSASVAVSEFADPIIYSQHPDVKSTLDDLKLSGSVYDESNNAAIFNSLPAWIIESDSSTDLSNLVQIIASYFDTLHNQIQALPELRNTTYASSSNKPAPFSYDSVASNGMVTPDIFADADIVSFIASRDGERKFDLDVSDIKNRIYQNIYNNLVYIYKSKGTEKAFRNLVHCYGVDEKLVRFNTYGNNVTYELKDNFRSTAVASNMVDFDDPTRFAATVYQATDSSNSNTVSFISGTAGGPIAGNEDYAGFTLETQVVFPFQADDCTTGSFSSEFVEASLFGMHSPITSDPANMGWASNDYANIKITARRPELYSSDAKFTISSDVSGIPTLTSSVFKDVYDNTRWNFAVRLINEKYPLGNDVLGVSTSGSTYTATPYRLEFCGYNYDLDILRNEFKVTASLASADGINFLRSAKRIYGGAHRTNFTASLLMPTDVKLYSMSYWADYLDDAAIKAHALDPETFGPLRPHQNAFQTQTALTGTYIPEGDLLALRWTFSDITSSNASGEFTINDTSSGSVALQTRYGWLGNIVKAQHSGKGAFFPASSQKSLDRDYVYVARQELPEIINSSEMINIMSNDTEFFDRTQRPVDYFFSVEKSMNQVISDEIINTFGTIVEFNDLIGDPVNRYRQDYKLMEKARSLFFEGVENSPDLDKFIDFYKWIDASLSVFLLQLVPASANYSEEVKNIVESHVLERNKYWTKFPTIEGFYTGSSTATAGATAYASSPARATPMHDPVLKRAPLPADQSRHAVYWKRFARRDTAPLATGIAGVDNTKQTILETLQSGYNREGKNPYYYTTVRSKTIHGGVNYTPGKDRTFVFNNTKPFSTVNGDGIPLNALQFGGQDVVDFVNIADVDDPNKRKFFGFKGVSKRGTDAGSATDTEGTYASFAKGAITAPFTLVSASVTTGYNEEVETAFKSGSVLANLHADTFSPSNDIPMQGPFTERHVGGHQSRHVNINRYDSSLSTTNKIDNYLTRAESWRMALGFKYSGAESSEIISINPADYVSGSSYPQTALRRATYYREEGAKRPVNIRNIKFSTASVNLGNYSKNYEVVSTVGRSTNNRYFIENNGVSLPSLYATALPATTNPNSLVAVAPGTGSTIAGATSNDYLNTKGVRLIGQGFCSGEGTFQPGWTMTGSLLDPSSLATGGTSTNEFTFSVWITSSATVPTAQGTLMMLGQQARPRHYMYIDTNEKLYFKAEYTTTNAEWVSDAAVITGSSPNSYHIAAAYKKGSDPPLVYVNGSPIAGTLTAPSGDLKPLISPSSIGCEINGSSGARQNSFQGTIAECSLWKKKLDATQILEIYDRGDADDLPGPQKLDEHSMAGDLLGWWRFGNGTSSLPHAAAGSTDSVHASPYFIYDQFGGFQLTGGVARCRQEIISFSASYLAVAGGGTSSISYTEVAGGGNYFGHRQNQPTALSNRFATSTNYSVGGRTKNETVFVNRFSAPGGPEVNSLGFLDIMAEEKSVYNALPYRNLSVRSSGSGEENSPATYRVMDQLDHQRGLRTLLALHCGKFGYDPTYGSVTAAEYVTKPAYQKNPRNTLRRLEFNTGKGYVEEGTVTTASVFCNANVSYAIPRTDIQYSWISSSYKESRIYGHAWNDSFVSNSAGVYQAIDFLTSSDTKASFAGGGGVQVNLAGVNVLIYDPLDIDANILSSSTGEYRNSDIGSKLTTPLPIPEVLNGLLLHRGGAYGLNTWRQIRGGDSPIARKLRERNLISYVQKSQYQYPLKAGKGATGVLPKFGALQKHYESPVIQKFSPIQQVLQIDSLTPENTTVQKSVVMKSSYGNSLIGFSNAVLNNRYDVDENFKVAYDKIKDLYLNNATNDPSSPVNSLERIVYKEAVYPASINVMSSSVRGRVDYSNTFWRTERDDREKTDANDLMDQSDLPITQSMWALDADKNFISAGTSRAPFFETTSTSGSGVLQNSYSQVHRGNIAQLTASAFYARRNTMENVTSVIRRVGGVQNSIPGLNYLASAPYALVDRFITWNYFSPIDQKTANNNMFAGQTQWLAGTQSNKQPWYNSYSDFVSQMRLLGKDYSVVPEFRISDHIDYYVTTAKGDFLAENLSIFEVTGGLASKNRSDEVGFFKTYSNSDFLKLFQVVRNEHAEIAEPSAVTLKCSGLLKFLPYDGFYPVDRTVQMAQQFSASYGPNVTYTGTHSTSSNVATRTFLAPFFAPGIMYNTIKSGIAVDYPMFSASLGITLELPNKQIHAGVSQGKNHSALLSGSGGEGRFHYRIPFEAMVEPEKYITDKDMIDLEPHPSCSIDVTASWGGQGDDRYKMMAHNFMAEVPNFFLPEGKMSSLVSKPERQFEPVKKDRQYAARIKVYKSLSQAAYRTGSLGYKNPFIPLQNAAGQYNYDLFETFTMYSRPSAFGPPCGCGQYIESAIVAGSPAGSTNVNIVYSSAGGLNMPFTPPYYDGECWADVIFTSPRSSTTENPITLQEIFSPDNLSVSYLRIGNEWTDNAASGTLFHANNVEYNSMQLDASFNLFGKAEIKSLQYDAETGKTLTAADDTESVWAIQPKFETPMMNFSGSRSKLGESPSWGSASCALGMWHQYGELPDDPTKGIFMQVTDIPENYIDKALGGDADLTGSLVDIVGFSTAPSRLGKVAPSKTVREAIVAVPFVEKDSERVFFNIERKEIDRALNLVEDGSVKQMVDAMQRYVLPPTMDFIMNPDSVSPFAMYIFEFEHTFNQEDLADMWQNLLPRLGYAFDEESNNFTSGLGLPSNQIVKHSTISHPLLAGEILSELPSKVQWMVFKVKQRANKNYFSNVINDQVNPVGNFNRTLGLDIGRKDSTKQFDPEYSYNWPYDFFSLVELVKIDAEVQLNKKKDS
jgi:hypothetical protein